MSRNEFLQTLNSLLHEVPEMERREMLYDYEEHFQIGLENGKQMKELTEELGDPYTIARDLLSDYHGTSIDLKIKKRGVGKKIWIGFGLFLFNALFIVAPLAAIFAVLVSIWVVALVFTLSPIVLITSSVLGYSYESLSVNFFVSLSLFSIGMLLGVGMLYVTKFFFITIKNYGKFNAKVIRGEQAA